MLKASRWKSLWQGFRLSPPAREFEALTSRYTEVHRHYHTARHITECLAHFDTVRTLCEHAEEVELALWFHDAIYDPRANDNEKQSAQWALRALHEAGSADPPRARVRALIMATCHYTLPDTQDAKVLVDIDLAILGADPARFAEYEMQVRAEYSWVPDFLFRRKRRDVLKSFLARESIYSTVHFQDQLEKKARENLARALSKRNGSSD